MIRQRWCKTFWVKSHILDRLLVSSCRAGILTVFTFSEGNALAHSCSPNKHSCIYQWQDNTHLIWTSNSFSCSPTSLILLVHSWKTVVQHRVHLRTFEYKLCTCETPTPCHTPTRSWLHFLCHDVTVWVHSLQMWEPRLLSVWEAINTNAVGIVANWSY